MIRYTLIIFFLVPVHMYGMKKKKNLVPPLTILCTNKILKIPNEYNCLDFPGQIPPLITNRVDELKKGQRTLIANKYKQAIKEHLKKLGPCMYIKNGSLSIWNDGQRIKTSGKNIRNPKIKLYIDTFNEKELTETQKSAILLHCWYQAKLTQEQIEEIQAISHEPLRNYMTAAVRA